MYLSISHVGGSTRYGSMANSQASLNIATVQLHERFRRFVMIYSIIRDPRWRK